MKRDHYSNETTTVLASLLSMGQHFKKRICFSTNYFLYEYTPASKEANRISGKII